MTQDNRTSADQEMRQEYDFSSATRGKHHLQYKAGTKMVSLDPDVAEAFPDPQSVNRALRMLRDLAKNQLRADT